VNYSSRTVAQLLFAAGWFQEGFHIVTGLLMAVVYVFFLEPRRGASPLLQGVLYGTAIWLLNALIVLPAIGEGIAGQYHLSAAGIGGFAVAHMSYFLTLSLLISSLRPMLWRLADNEIVIDNAMRISRRWDPANVLRPEVAICL
jgi:uncharacterized membrane protein YagU involved in acid resistance